MIKNVKLANRVILAIVVLLGVACITIAAIDLTSGSTSMLLESAKWILVALMSVAVHVRSIVNKESAFTRYLSLGLVVMTLVFLVVLLVHHPTREWP
jgi:hypothetical protein